VVVVKRTHPTAVTPFLKATVVIDGATLTADVAATGSTGEREGGGQVKDEEEAAAVAAVSAAKSLHAFFRMRFGEVVAEAVVAQSAAPVAAFVAEIEASSAKELCKPMLEDLNGQVMLALSSKAFLAKWGRHYLPSLGRAHLLQLATNFKDAGLQGYGGTVFNELRDQGDDIFVDLPAPTHAPDPQLAQLLAQFGGGAAHAPAAAQAAVHMSRYHSRSNVCFATGARATMADGSMVPVEQLEAGDTVRVAGGLRGADVARIMYIVRTRCADGYAHLVTLNAGKGMAAVTADSESMSTSTGTGTGTSISTATTDTGTGTAEDQHQQQYRPLRITPWHPVRIDGSWVFPATCEGAAAGRRPRLRSRARSRSQTPQQEPDTQLASRACWEPCEAVYSFALDRPRGSTMVVEGIECAALGHGMLGPVIGHPFFGTDRVLTQLAELTAANGVLELDGGGVAAPPHVSDSFSASMSPASRVILVRNADTGIVTSFQRLPASATCCQ
jgi:hypothetical protein